MPVVLAISMLAGFVVLVPVVLLHGAPAFQAGDVAWAVVSGAVAVGSLGLMYRAMAVGPVSIVGPVSACGVAIPVIVGLARGEQPHPVQLAGIAVAVMGVILASVEKGPDDRGKQVVAGFWLALAAAVCIGVWFVTFDRASTDDPYWAATVARTTTAVIAIIAALLVRRSSANGLRRRRRRRRCRPAAAPSARSCCSSWPVASPTPWARSRSRCPRPTAT